MKISYLDWDSRTFGYKIGVVSIKSDEQFNPIRKIAESEGYKLIYIKTSAGFADQGLIDDGGVLVDEKMHYVKKIMPFQPSDNTGMIRTYDLKECSSDLLQLTLESGILSRFKNDKGFVRSEFETLYRIWIGNAVERSNIFIYVVDSRIRGFVSYKLYDAEINIELIAVDSTFRGGGIAIQLMREVELLGMKKGVTTMTVDTQKCNFSACRVYEKFGFQVSNIEKIYHLWIN